MLRFLSERRAWVIAAFVALMLVIGIVVWLAPHASARASTFIGERFGVDASIEQVRLSFGGVELTGVQLQGRHGGFSVRIDRLDAQVNPFAAVFRGGKAVRGVLARGIEVDVDLTDEGFDDSVATLRMRRPVEKPSVTSTDVSGRTYEVRNLTLRIIDADGSLVVVKDVTIQKEGNELRSSVEEAVFGQSNADHAAIGPSTVVLRRLDGEWKVHELGVDHATLGARRDDDGLKRALALRMREAWSRFHSKEKVANVDDRQAGSADGTSPNRGASALMFDRLTPDAHLASSRVQIESRTSNGHVEQVRDLEWALHGAGDGWYRLLVAGQTSNGGRLKVDMNVMPRDARAEGSIELRRISLSVLAPFAPDLPLYETDLGTISANLDLEASSPDSISIAGGFKVRELALSSERIALEPVEHINVDLAGKGTWHPGERLLEIERGRVQMGKAVMGLEGEVERTSEHYRVDLTAKLPPTKCNDVISAVPSDLLGSLAQIEWSGNWSALARISIDSRELEASELSIRIRDLCQFERVPDWVRVEQFHQPFRHRVIEPDDTLFEMRTGPGTANWVAFAEISPFVLAAVISHEDGAFYEHGGFAPWAIRDALVRNLQEGRYVVGASTISMQLAKNLYLAREKTIARKVQEVILTWWLENALTKDEILELYLNVIEYGPGVYGLRPAAAYYFGREPEDLSPAESAFLACMLPSPKRYHLSYERGSLTRAMKGNMRRLLEHMAKRQRIGPEALAYGLAELDAFHFRRDGDALPPARTLPPLGAPETPEPESLDPYEVLFVAP